MCAEQIIGISSLVLVFVKFAVCDINWHNVIDLITGGM